MNLLLKFRHHLLLFICILCLSFIPVKTRAFSIEEIKDDFKYSVFVSRSFSKIHLVIKSFKRQSAHIKVYLYNAGKSFQKERMIHSGENIYIEFRNVKKGRCVMRIFYRFRFFSESDELLKELSFLMP